MHGPMNVKKYVNCFHNHLAKNFWCNSAIIAILYGSIKSRHVRTLLIICCNPNVEQSKPLN